MGGRTYQIPELVWISTFCPNSFYWKIKEKTQNFPKGPIFSEILGGHSPPLPPRLIRLCSNIKRKHYLLYKSIHNFISKMVKNHFGYFSWWGYSNIKRKHNLLYNSMHNFISKMVKTSKNRQTLKSWKMMKKIKFIDK